MNNELTIKGTSDLFYRFHPEMKKKRLAEIQIELEICKNICDRRETCPYPLDWFCDYGKGKFSERISNA